MDVHEAVTVRLRTLLKEKGWTATELINRSGVNQSTISEIMSGRSKYPRIITLKKIAHGFDMTLSEFFDDDVFSDLKNDK